MLICGVSFLVSVMHISTDITPLKTFLWYAPPNLTYVAHISLCATERLQILWRMLKYASHKYAPDSVAHAAICAID
jgi:hypothetical protein